MSLLSKLTIICLTYERQFYVRRQLAYFQSFPVKIIFADGSSKHLGIGNQGEIGLLRWEYIHIPGAATAQTRLSEALELVDTDYLCLMPDDDIFIGSGLESAVSKLERENDLVFAGGKVGRFISKRDSLVFYKDSHWTDDFSMMSDDPGIRLLSMIESVRTANVFYVVARSTGFKDILRTTSRLNFSYNSASELVICGLLAAKSKYEIGQYPFWMRGDELSIDPKLYSRGIDALTWYSQFSEEIESVKVILIEALVEQGYDADYALLTIDKYLDIHHQQHIPPDESIQEKEKIFEQKTVSLLKLKNKLHALTDAFIESYGAVRLKRIFYILMESHGFIGFLWRKFLIKKRFFRSLLYRLFTNQEMYLILKGYSPLNIVGFWREQCGKLTEEQRSDLLNVSSLLRRFPSGINDNQILFDFLGMKEQQKSRTF